MSTVKKFAGQTAIYGSSTILSRLLNFIMTPVFLWAYTPGVYTIFTTLYAWASMINAMLAFGLETTFFRFINKHSERKSAIYANSFLITLVLSASFVTLCLFFAPAIADLLRNNVNRTDFIRYVTYFAWILAADALAVIPFAQIRASGRPFRYSIVKLANIAIFVLANVGFIFILPYLLHRGWISKEAVAWFRPGWIGYVFISNLVASTATLVLLLPEILRINLQFNRKLALEMFAYSFPVLVANLSFILNENVDKMMMNNLLPDSRVSDVGIYGGCAKIAIFLSIFVQAFRLGAEPFFFSHAKQKDATRTYAVIMNYFVIAVCCIFVVLVTNIEIFKHFINNRDYWVGLNVVPILLFGYVSLGIYMNLSIWYKLSDQTRYGLYISGLGAILTIVLNFIFLPKYSYMAAAWIHLAAYASMMILSYVLGQKNYPIPYKLRKNILYLVSSAGVAALSFLVFKRDLLAGNILLAAYIAAILYFEKDELKKLWKMS